MRERSGAGPAQIIGLKKEARIHKSGYEMGKDDHLLEHPGFPKLLFVEGQYNEDPTNWWIPNRPGLEAMVRSAGLGIIDRPHRHSIVKLDSLRLSSSQDLQRLF